MRVTGSRLLTTACAVVLGVWAMSCVKGGAPATPAPGGDPAKPQAAQGSAGWSTVKALKPPAKESIKLNEEAVLTEPPLVPPPIKRTEPANVKVTLEVIEKEMRLADGVTYTFWTYGGSVPGKFIRVREGDYVEFHFKNNANNKLPHNIDLHAVTGPGGGAASSFAAPGHEVVFNFTPMNPGLYVYHCATAPVGMHVANGMYGCIYVQPAEPLPDVDKEWYVVQSDIYTQGGFGASGLQPFDMQKALDEKPTYVVFNGAVGSITGDRALQAKVGDRIRLFVGNGGPNLVSSFHVIGEIFDNVWEEGGTTCSHHVQTTLVPAGGSAIVEFVAEVPGNLILADHSILRTFNKGALGMIKITGEATEEMKRIYSGKLSDQVLQLEGSAIQTLGTPPPPPPTLNLEQKMKEGERLYKQACQTCHQAEGVGVEAAYPPLANSSTIAADWKLSVRAIIYGLTGPLTVNGKNFNGVMPAMAVTDGDIANIVTYINKSWGNNQPEVSLDDVKTIRAAGR